MKGNVLSVSGSWAINVDYIAYFPVWKHDIAVLSKPRQFSSNEHINNLTPDKSHICRGANYEAIEISDCDWYFQMISHCVAFLFIFAVVDKIHLSIYSDISDYMTRDFEVDKIPHLSLRELEITRWESIDWSLCKHVRCYVVTTVVVILVGAACCVTSHMVGSQYGTNGQRP